VGGTEGGPGTSFKRKEDRGKECIKRGGEENTTTEGYITRDSTERNRNGNPETTRKGTGKKGGEKERVKKNPV